MDEVRCSRRHLPCRAMKLGGLDVRKTELANARDNSARRGFGEDQMSLVCPILKFKLGQNLTLLAGSKSVADAIILKIPQF